MVDQLIFANFNTFYEFINKHPWTVENNEHVAHIRQLIREMNTQCPCKRKNYIGKIDALYRSLEHKLSTPERSSIKQAANANSVHFQQNGATFLII